MSIRWALVHEDGRVHGGDGRAPGLGASARAAVAGVLFVDDRPIVFSCPMDLLWTVQRSTDPRQSCEYWGVRLPPGARVWLSSRSVIVGVGETVEAVERAWAALRAAGVAG